MASAFGPEHGQDRFVPVAGDGKFLNFKHIKAAYFREHLDKRFAFIIPLS